MYGVVEISGHQYRVKAGDVIDVQKIEGESGTNLNFDRVLFVGGESVQVGTPLVAGANVKAQVIRQGKSKKLLGARRSPGLYFKRKNHRQLYTALLITELSDGQGKTDKYKGPEKEENKDGA